MGIVSNSIITAITALLITTLLPNEASGAAKKGKVATGTGSRLPTVRKLSSTEVLISQLRLNSYEQGQSLAVTCNRTNFKNLAIALNMNARLLNSEKGEFETSEEYAARADRLAKIFAPFRIAVCEWIDDNPDVAFSYQADNGQFNGRFSKNHNIWRDVKHLGSYRTKTRMGIPATVSASAEMEYNLSLDLPTDVKGCLAGGYGDLTFSAAVDRAAAPSIKARGRLVILGTLFAPYIAKEETHDSATLDDPYEVYNNRLIAHLKPDQIAVIGANGEVVWQCIPGRFNPSPSPTPIGEWMSTVERLGYPYSLRQKPTGIFEAVLSVGPDGKASNCKVSASSGYPNLDNATCESLAQLGKFTPAADTDGNPISGEYTARINWQITN